jgi:EAL domain-containing protein (putative c-di-GMP-specific phosphodiesterase class I)/CheY-like chemotaxis protein
MQRMREPRGQALHNGTGHRHGPASTRDDAVILVVDRDSSLRATFAMVLTGMGPRVLEASSGGEALRLATEHDVALVVLDNAMADESGLEILAELRARPATARVPVIFVAGVSDVSERVRALEAGVHDYLVKPIDMDELRARVRSHLVRDQDRIEEENRFRRLTSAVTTLCKASVGDSVEVIAAAACSELGQLHDGVDLTLHAFMGDGMTECLAGHRSGVTTPGGRPLDAEAARRAYQRAAGGPWLETTHADPVHNRSIAPVLPGPRTVGWVPLSVPNQVLGVVMISGPGFVVDDLTTRVTEAMATAVELAPTITMLLESSLGRLTDFEDRRTRLHHVMDGAFFPVFQPIMGLSDRKIEGYEAFARFEDGTRPELGLAEAASLGGLVALEAALCRAALEAVPSLPPAEWVSVNVSPSLLMDTSTLRDAIGDHTDPPLVLEITERDRIDDYEVVRRAVDDLGIEIRLAVDDVGKGWSCLHHILDLEPSFIKLDTSWVRGIERDPTRQALVRGLSQFSKRTGAELIAEGIETERQLAKLIELDVRLGQGFHLGRPARMDGSGPSPASRGLIVTDK